jgi:gliding motility-associated peptidyl-prolyl isomerase
MKHALLFTLTISLVFGCKSSEARRPISNNSGSFIDASIERNKQLNNKEYAQIASFIKNSERPFLSSDFGFWYAYNTKIDTNTLTPKFGDLVYYTYLLKTLDGQVIYSANKEIQTYYIDQQELFSGLRQGLKLMKNGEAITFLFPSQKAYGYYGDNDKIGSNVPLICEVSLLKLTKN